MNLLFLVDPPDRLDPAHDSSIALMAAAAARGHRVLVAEMRALSVRDSRVFVRAQPADLRSGSIVGAAAAAVDLDDVDLVLVRTDPPVDDNYLRATYLLDFAQRRGTPVCNRPEALRSTNEKLFALNFPHLIPETLVSASAAELVDAVRRWGRAVLKPTDAMGGRGVLLLEHAHPNLTALIDVGTARGQRQVVLQRFVDDGTNSDRRVLVVDGEPVAALRRTAKAPDFRCNMAVGASAVAVPLSGTDRDICAVLRPELVGRGIAFAGVDIVDDRLIEVNVTSPTGLREIDGGSGAVVGRVADEVLRRLLTHVG
ncbi:glutathione synthase [Streptomyces sp. SID8361]|uniref:glutathione synthase n=1 Tax=Streptomyces sp. MnatMP-M27 TaxID=1839768 RepID=UPI00081D88B7|nr:glutathione synthase [Streptomyces sp. MnatMP-M27]MYU16108.1 glutathione synthase [Streptomyces sp. SID8361]SCG10667.1 glutathione synthase [Streptomyces sp. MnatMP-M27]